MEMVDDQPVRVGVVRFFGCGARAVSMRCMILTEEGTGGGGGGR